MARCRMIKPEFWSSEDILELDIADRLFYIGFWNFCDDNGILPDKPKSIKCNIFPADMIDCKPIIENLVSCGLLVRYNVGTESYLRVAKWDRHQTIRHPTFKYPVETGEIPVHVRYKSGTSTEGVPQKEKEKEKEKIIKDSLSEQSSDVADWLEKADSFYLDLCQWFYDNLVSLDLVKKNTNWKTEGWYNGFKRLLTIDGVDYESQFKPIMNFYLMNYGKEFCPIAESPTSVRTKWKKLEAYYRNNNKKPMGSARP